MKILGATLTPFWGAGYYTDAGEAKRQALNEWIRTSGAYDGVVDFDKATRDPSDPKKMLAAYLLRPPASERCGIQGDGRSDRSELVQEVTKKEKRIATPHP